MAGRDLRFDMGGGKRTPEEVQDVPPPPPPPSQLPLPHLQRLPWRPLPTAQRCLAHHHFWQRQPPFRDWTQYPSSRLRFWPAPE